jgi:hypothetical protein
MRSPCARLLTSSVDRTLATCFFTCFLEQQHLALAWSERRDRWVAGGLWSACRELADTVTR